MLVSHKHRFILIKTRKTAGSSLEGLLEPLCLPEGHVPQHATEATVTKVGIVAARAVAQEKKNTGYAAHMTAQEICDALGRRTFDRYTKIIPVRDPFDKVVSRFWHVMPAETKERVSDDFTQARTLFLDWIKMRPMLNTDKLSYRTKRGTFPWFLVRYERLREDVAELSRTLGIPLAFDAMPRWKSRNRLHREYGKERYYDREAADIVRKRFAFDFKYLGYDPHSVCPP